jgi:hypothetical protein
MLFNKIQEELYICTYIVILTPLMFVSRVVSYFSEFIPIAVVSVILLPRLH